MSYDTDTPEIHLWCSFPSEVRDAALLSRYHALLSEPEVQRERRFRFERHRHAYLVTRALVRTVLARYTGRLPEELVFEENDYGRPRIARDDMAGQALAFSVTRTGGLVVLAVARGMELGVDAECVSSRNAASELADRFFSPDEVAALDALPPTRQRDRFVDYWTLKEAYIKALGMGVSIPLDHFSFYFQSKGRIKMSTHLDLDDDEGRWRFYQLSVRSRFVVAVCTERLPRPVPKLIVKRTVPLVQDANLDYILLRASG